MAIDPVRDQVNMHSLGCGGWVVRDDGAVMLVRMTYGAANGRLMLPGGHADDGEFLHDTALREVLEETGLRCSVDGLVMVRQRLPEGGQRNLYFVFAMTPLDGAAPCPQLSEVSECLWLTPSEILARDDVQPIVTELAAAWQAEPRHWLAERALAWQDPSWYRVWTGGEMQVPK